jgi:hypothetical protein
VYPKSKLICPHLLKWVIPTCRALDEPYALSLFELEEYCKTMSYRKCPFLMSAAKSYISESEVTA